jgi:hypothetical protein
MKTKYNVSILTGFINFLKKEKVSLIIVFVILGTYLIFEWDKYSTFEKSFTKKIHADTTIESMTIRIYDTSDGDGYFPERKAWVTIKDKKTINAVLEDFSELKLKRDDDARVFARKYSIDILVTNEEKPNFLVSNSIVFEVDENYLNDYKILGETEHLKTIESLVNNKEIEWITND